MAVRVTKELICDICGIDGDIRRYRLTRTDNKTSVTADLCPEHRELIDEIMTRKKKGRRTRRVYTPEEIAAKRKPAKKAAKKTTPRKR
jgi:hypothetical protein